MFISTSLFIIIGMSFFTLTMNSLLFGSLSTNVATSILQSQLIFTYIYTMLLFLMGCTEIIGTYYIISILKSVLTQLVPGGVFEQQNNAYETEQSENSEESGDEETEQQVENTQCETNCDLSDNECKECCCRADPN